jgi:cyclopropane fatty-acyl-phospholipid synthase-like methyltransferase
LTTPAYWGKRQKNLPMPKEDRSTKDLLDAIEPFLRSYENKRFIELGCSPGRMSLLLHQRLPFMPFGIDSSPEAHLYKEAMMNGAGVEAVLFNCDVREFITHEQFDVVMSFGLVEHFSDPDEILNHHYRLCKEGGLIVVSIPHLRYFQWLYHYLFDRTDLLRHNIKMMTLGTFQAFSDRMVLKVLFLGYIGSIFLWNVDETGPRIKVVVRRLLSVAVRGITNLLISKLLPPNNKYYAPYIVLVARRI